MSRLNGFIEGYEKQMEADKLERIRLVFKMVEDLCLDQSNGLTDGEICISAMKDIRRILNED